jgi:AbrB family looped-hinge helix DNA binding protein
MSGICRPDGGGDGIDADIYKDSAPTELGGSIRMNCCPTCRGRGGFNHRKRTQRRNCSLRQYSSYCLMSYFLQVDGLYVICQILDAMSTATKNEAVWFTTKGQVVIPARLRRQFHIENGTKAIVEATPEGILLKPVTSVTIRRLRGILKRKPGDKPFAEEWAEHKREELELEGGKHAHSTGTR